MRNKLPGDPMTTVSYRAPRRYIMALRMYAVAHGTQVGDLLRDITDATIGDELATFLAIFPAPAEPQTSQADSSLPVSEGMVE